MMSLICPECQSRCRLKNNRTDRNASQGRCPNCDALFPIPTEAELSQNRQSPCKDETEKSSLTPTQEVTTKLNSNSRKSIKELIFSYAKKPLWPIFAGSILVVFFISIFLNANQLSPPTQQNSKQNINSPQTPPKSEPAAPLQLSPRAKAKAIALIKHHALVSDASINIDNHQFQLALLVTAKTPVSYSERLGRQFVHYIKKEVATTNQHYPTFEVSVYYPGGTRVEVTTTDKILEEEILQ